MSDTQPTGTADPSLDVVSASSSNSVSEDPPQLPQVGILETSWRLSDNSQAAIYQWAVLRAVRFLACTNIRYIQLITHLFKVDMSHALSPGRDRLRCEQHEENPSDPPEKWKRMTRYEEHLAWLLIGGGLDGMLDNEKLDFVNHFRSIAPKTDQAVGAYIGRRINKAFAPWIDTPLAFRQVMRSTHSIVSGSVALQAAIGSSWSCNDLDVYVDAGSAKDIVINYLMGEESYIIIQEREFPESRLLGRKPKGSMPWSMRWVTSVTELEKRVATLRGEVVRRIDVMQSVAHATLPVASFSATWCMNWIGSDEIIVQYPRTTLVYAGILNWPCEIDTEEDAVWLAAYIGRGFKIVDGIGSRSRRYWQCTPICKIRRQMDDGSDRLRAVTSTYDESRSPENGWICHNLKDLSNFGYTCEDHGDVGEGPRNDIQMYDNYRAWVRYWPSWLEDID